MVSLTTPICDFGWSAKDFQLPGVDNKHWNIEGIKGTNGLVVMFICNHCPYVKAIMSRLVNDVNELKKFGIEFTVAEGNTWSDFEKALQKNTKLLYIETPSNPQLKLSDIKTISKFALRINLKDINTESTLWTVYGDWRKGSKKSPTKDDGSNALVDEIMLSF